MIFLLEIFVRVVFGTLLHWLGLDRRDRAPICEEPLHVGGPREVDIDRVLRREPVDIDTRVHFPRGARL